MKKLKSRRVVRKAEHIPGTPYRYRHGWIPVGSTGRMHSAPGSRRLRARREPGSAELQRRIEAHPEETARMRRVARANAEEHGVARTPGAPGFRSTNPLGEAVSHGTPTEPKRGDSTPKKTRKKTLPDGTIKTVTVSGKKRVIRNRKKVTQSQVARTELPGPAPMHLRQEALDYANQHYPAKEEKYAGLIVRLAKTGKAQDPKYRGQQSQKYGIPAGRMIEIENEMHEIMYPTPVHHSESASVRLADMPEVQRKAIRAHGGRSASVYPDGRTRLTKATKGEHRGKYVKLSGNGSFLGVVDDKTAAKDIADNKAHWKAQEQKAKQHPRRWIHEPIINAAGRPDWHSRLLSLEDWEKEKAKIEQGHADKQEQAKAKKAAKIRIAQQWAEAQGYDPEDSYWWGYYWSDPSLVKNQDEPVDPNAVQPVHGRRVKETPKPKQKSRRGEAGRKADALPAVDLDQRDIRGHRPGPKRDIKRGEDLQEIANEAAKQSSRQRRKIQKLDPFRYIIKAEHVPGTPYHFRHGWIPIDGVEGVRHRAGTRTRGTGAARTRGPWDHKSLGLAPGVSLTRLPHNSVHQMVGMDGKPLARKRMTPEKALYLRNNGATKITDSRLAELHKDRSSITAQEYDLLMNAAPQMHLDGDHGVKVYVKRDRIYKNRPRWQIIKELRNNLGNDAAKAQGAQKGAGGQVIRRPEQEAQRLRDNEKRRLNRRNAFSRADKDRIMDEFSTDGGKTAICGVCGKKDDPVLRSDVSPERLMPGQHPEVDENGDPRGIYVHGNVVPAHPGCNNAAGTDAQNDPEAYYQDALKRMLRLYPDTVLKRVPHVLRYHKKVLGSQSKALELARKERRKRK